MMLLMNSERYIKNMFRYKTSGTCSKEIIFNVIDNKIYDLSFIGGCDGNLKGISTLVNGMSIDMVIEKLKNIRCGKKYTSCPDQLANALEQYMLLLENNA